MDSELHLEKWLIEDSSTSGLLNFMRRIANSQTHEQSH